jgi:hypothetical protein
MRPSEYYSAVLQGLVQREGPNAVLPERRPKRRARALLQAIITYGIRDLSESGARLAIPKSFLFPSAFYLINVRARSVHDARVIWCGGAQAGVEFAKTFPLSEISDPQLGYLKRLWLERAAR